MIYRKVGPLWFSSSRWSWRGGEAELRWRLGLEVGKSRALICLVFGTLGIHWRKPLDMAAIYRLINRPEFFFRVQNDRKDSKW